MADLGLLLKREREARNISLEEIASSTKIVPRYLEALEADRLDIMPGGFFIKGIIRTYTRYLGLDEEEVLSRYRAAGVLGESAPHRRPPPPGSTPRAPSPASPTPRIIPTPKPSPPSSASPAPPPVVLTPPPSSPPAPHAGPPPTSLFAPVDAPPAKKRLLYGLMVVGVIGLLLALILLLWTVLRPKPASEPLAGSALPSIEQPQASTAAEPAPQEPEPLPAAQEPIAGVAMDIVFEGETWMQVFADGILKIDGLFPPGTKAKVRADTELLIHVGNAGGFSFLLNGRPGKPLGRAGAVIKDIRITADNFKDFLQAQSPESPAD
ncbi:MAG: helix-turn-helix domain-containing protein [Candidatus Aminicenantes bacterium]